MNTQRLTAAEKIFIVGVANAFAPRNAPQATNNNLEFLSAKYIISALSTAATSKQLNNEEQKLARDLKSKVRE
jgi:hypothetical protein